MPKFLARHSSSEIFKSLSNSSDINNNVYAIEITFVPIWTFYSFPLQIICPFQLYLLYSGQYTKRMELFKNNYIGQALIVFSHKRVLVHTQDKDKEKEGVGEDKSVL